VVINGSRLVKGFVLLVAMVSVAACGLPRTGPSKQEIFAGSVQQEGDAFIVTVDDFVTRATSVVPALGFDQSFLEAGVVGSDTIQPGDTLSLQIWENVETGLLASSETGSAALEEVQVDGEGFIFVP
jgi:polysaccharide export outer membrane protein